MCSSDLNVIVGRSRTEAEEKFEHLNSLIEPIVAREILATFLGVDLAGHDLDAPVPDLKPTAASSGSFNNWMDLARRENLTLRQMAFRAARGRMAIVRGSASDIADHMEAWFRGGACDGFNIMPPYLPGAFDDFVALVVPELQRRGLFRTEYEGRTYRENLGLKRPGGRYAKTG